MFRHGNTRRAVLLLMVLAVAFLWTADQGIRAAATDRAEVSATPAPPPPSTTAKAADKAAAATTVKDPPPATTATADATAAAPQKPPTNRVTEKRLQNQKIQEAAKAARARGLKPGVAGLAGTGFMLAAGDPLPPLNGTNQGPGGVPHYFGPYGNWAYSPLPEGTITGFVVIDGGKGYTAPVVTINDAYDATKADTATATLQGSKIGSVALIGNAPLPGYTAPVVTITDPTGSGAVVTATLSVAGGIPKFVDRLPGLGPTGANALGQYIPVAAAEPCTFSGQAADCYTIALVEYTETLSSSLPPTRLRGYVQLSANGTIATLTNPDGSTIPLPTGLKAVDYPHYLGPLILASGRVAGLDAAGIPAGAPKPVRITFYNLLPTGSGGDLFLPVDETVPGSGLGPAGPGVAGSKYTQNRATIHLHGNNTVWISDGNTHQWITPAGEGTPYPAGVSARNVPDMPDAATGRALCAADTDPNNPLGPGGSGCMTFFYTNAQSARLQFYHDHAHGITRLNVYAGEAAGYLLTDAVEKDLMDGTNVTGVNPGLLKVLPGLGIPLIIQDKTFVDANTVFAQDPTWNWGTGPRDATTRNITGAVTGDLWYPHVYMSVSNPYDVTGANAFGRWFYGPWFNPPTPVCVNGLPLGCIEVGLVPNEYYDPANAPWEPPVRPGVPNPSIPGESFMDTPLVNGTAYPYVEVPAGPVRFRVLNANNDRALNLQLYQAFDKAGFHFGTGTTDPSTATQACAGPDSCTEVKMVPVSVAPANQFADTPSGIPDPTTAGPPWIQIGTEGGFMPAPVEVPQQPIGFNMNTGQFAFGIVNQHSLYLLPAERADVIVDFTGKSGTYILYNDAPAPVPAGAAVYDYYSGDGDQTGSGGPPNTLPGYGPNTRTIMQIRITGTAPVTNYSLANLQAVWAKNSAAGKRGVFELSQDPIIIPQAAYGSAYESTTFPADASQYILNVGAFDKTFRPLGYDSATTAWSLQPAVTMPLELKAMHDEMGGVYDTMFGRMSGILGLTHPGFPGVIPYPFSAPPTDLVKGSLDATPIGTLADGTQLWRIFHNGVDTHPIHTHLFTAQLINRVGQDGQVVEGALPVDPGDVGWKDTFKINPLEIAFFALRPTVPTVSQVPFEVPISIRLIDPTLPEGATLPPPGPAGWFDPATNAIPQILNHYVNFGWEYVWHCHILSHEEMDFMHTLVFAAPPTPPTLLSAAPVALPLSVNLTWDDNSTVETQFTIQRASDQAFTIGLRTFTVVSPTPNTKGPRTYADTTVVNNNRYWYRVFANGAIVGDTSMANFPTMSADSVSNALSVDVGTPPPLAPNAPTALTAAVLTGPQVRLTWSDNATNETGFSILRCAGTGCTPVQIAVAPLRTGTGSTTYVDTAVAFGTTYFYQVVAVNVAGSSAPSNTATVSVAAIPAAPTSFTVSVVKAGGNNYTASLAWTSPVNPTNFTIQRATNLGFTTGLATFTVTGTARTLTQTVTRNTTYYYRIRANNNIGGSSAWTNALPFPIRTGK